MRWEGQNSLRTSRFNKDLKEQRHRQGDITAIIQANSDGGLDLAGSSEEDRGHENG